LLGFASNILFEDLGAKPFALFVQYLALWRPGQRKFGDLSAKSFALFVQYLTLWRPRQHALC